MQNFGISQNQPIQSNYPVGPKKKDDKQEKIQKAITYTIGTLAGVGFAALMGYTMVHKGSVKKVVDGAKKNAQKVAEKSKTISPANKTNRNIVFKTLANINSGKQVTLKELRETQNVLNQIKDVCASDSIKGVLNEYVLLFKVIIDANREHKNTDKFKVNLEDSSIKEAYNVLNEKSENILTEVIAQTDFNSYTKTINVNLKNIKQDGTSLKHTNGSSINLTDTDKCPKPDNIISVCESKNLKIYAKKDYTNFDDDTDLYIKQGEQYYNFKAAQLKNIAEVTEIEDANIIKDTDIHSFADDVKILQCKINGETEAAQYIFGAQNTSKESKYIKVSDLSETHLGQLFNMPLVTIETDKLNTTGNALMAALNEKINKAEDDKKAEIITSALSGIEGTKFGDKSVGQVVVNSLNVTEAVLGGVFNTNTANKFVNTDGKLTTAGNALMAALNEKISKAGNDTDKTKIITSAISGIEDKKFGDKSVGQAVVNSLNVTEAVLGVAFNTNTDNKFVDADGKLTTAGNALMAALNEKINKAEADQKAEIITSTLSGIDDGKFGDKSVGKAVVTSLMNADEIAPEVFVDVFSNLKVEKLVKNDKTLTETGKALLDKMIEKGLSLDDLNSVVDGKIKGYQNDNKGIQTTDNETPKLQVNRAKYYFNYLKKIKDNGGEISNTESLIFYSLLKNEKKGEYFTNTTLKLEKLNNYDETDFTSDTITYKEYSNIDLLNTAISTINSGNTKLISLIPRALDATTLGQVLNDSSLKDKLVDTSATSNQLTGVGSALIEAIKMRINGESNFNVKAGYISNMLEVIDDGKFASDEIGQFVVDAIVANTDFSTLGEVLNNLKDKLIDTSATDDNKKLKPLGQVLLKGYANQTLSTMHRKISYSRPDGSTERNRIKTEITINGVRFKFYNKDNEIKYYVGQTR